MSNSDVQVLIIEDTNSIGVVMQSWLKKAEINSELVGTGKEGIERIQKGGIKVLLLDLQLPDMNGLEVLDLIKSEGLNITTVVVTASGSITTAVDAMRRGAYDFLVKPTAQERLLTTTKNALERETLNTAVKQIKKDFKKGGNHGFIGSSLPMIAIYKTIDAVARSSACVFISGESGTGKELCAEAIHIASNRKRSSFVALNCAAIPKDLIESEVFGHVKGAFTGATSDREGAAFSADGGTLFLDEVCEMDLKLQSKLLRFLQTGTVQKVGSDKLEKVDVRILCATNRNPLLEVEEGRFREDLYYRLHVIPVELPPLRNRESDVIEIAKFLLKQISEEEGKNFNSFTQEAVDALLSHSWPGNVRELQNIIRNAVILNEGEKIDSSMFSFATKVPEFGSVAAFKAANTIGINALSVSLNQSFADIEREIIEGAINQCDGSIPKASDMLSLSPSTIYRKKESWV